MKKKVLSMNELLKWYENNKRSLPWRESADVYCVMVAEIMAQQTRIAQLLPFYEKFMAKFPTLEKLAQASEDDVLTLWAGMGYYARARNLHRAAKIITESGTLPQTRKEWESLPGIGAYTAGAILSIAQGKREVAVDGNVLRVYARLSCDATDITTPAAKKSATAFLEKIMPHTPKEISAFTQSLMELGALVCLPQHPRCEICPVATDCQAFLSQRTHQFPVKTAKPAPALQYFTVIIAVDPHGRVLMRRRTEGLLKGMWVYYLLEGKLLDNEMLVREQIKSMGFTPTSTEALGEATHTFTHRKWQMKAYSVTVKENRPVGDYQFLTPHDINKAALPAAMKYFTHFFAC
jgi:A/G-specific adenine glycosylase